ncbi:Bifunctional dehydrogenase and ferrochelatase [Cryptotrichosporon argae]
MSTEQDLPPIRKGASLMLAYQLAGRRVLLIGGGVVASGRLFFLLEAGAHVTLIAPAPLEPSIAARVAAYPDDVTWLDRGYAYDDAVKVTDFNMVMTAIDDVALSRHVCGLARAAKIPVNVADVPPECDFYFGAQFRQGPLQVMVSTSGKGPKVAVMVRDALRAALPDNVEEAIDGVGALRGELRARAPGTGGELGRRRMEWMIGTCDKWTLKEMGDMRQDEVRRRLLDEGWEKGVTLGPSEVGLGQQQHGWAARAAGALGVKCNAGVLGGLGGLATGLAIGSLATLYLARR